MEQQTTINNQENNQLLLNAIKNKFAAQTASESSSFSPPKFNIPALNIPMKLGTPSANSSLENVEASPQQNQLNQFLLKQLKEKQAASNNGFVVPPLQLNNKNSSTSSKSEIPSLKTSSAAVTTSSNTRISNLTMAINKLQVQENVTQTINTSSLSPAIDLTTALSSKTHHQNTPPQRSQLMQQRKQNENLNFDIPFIECDRKENTILKTIANEYCTTDVSELALRPTTIIVQQPSIIGCILDMPCIKYKPLTFSLQRSCKKRPAQPKHIIEPFQFNTKSPDDLVLESLNKIKRRIIA